MSSQDKRTGLCAMPSSDTLLNHFLGCPYVTNNVAVNRSTSLYGSLSYPLMTRTAKLLLLLMIVLLLLLIVVLAVLLKPFWGWFRRPSHSYTHSLTLIHIQCSQSLQKERIKGVPSTTKAVVSETNETEFGSTERTTSGTQFGLAVI